MKTTIPALAAFLLLTPLALLSSAAADAAPPAKTPAKAVCPVCAVHEGESDAEPVKASRAYEGKTYGFCSEKCAATFDEDPIAYLPPVLPRPMPAFTVESLSGEEVPFAKLAARGPVLVDFWATWCAPCVSAMPRLQQLHRRHAGTGFSVVGISIDEDHGKARKLIEKKKLAYPTFLDATATPAWSVLHVRAVPAMFLVDGDGRIVRQWLGKVDLKEVESAVAGLAGGGSEKSAGR